MSFWPLDDPKLGSSSSFQCRFLYLAGSPRPHVSPSDTSDAAGVLFTLPLPAEMAQTLQVQISPFDSLDVSHGSCQNLYTVTAILRKSQKYRSCSAQEILDADVQLCDAPLLLIHNAKVCRKAAAGLGPVEVAPVTSGGEADWLLGTKVW